MDVLESRHIWEGALAGWGALRTAQLALLKLEGHVPTCQQNVVPGWPGQGLQQQHHRLWVHEK